MPSLTEQPVAKSLLRFCIPMTIGGILTQLYSLTNAIIIGRFAGVNALAAVGAGAPISTMLIALMAGFGAGAEILIARYYGEGDIKRAKQAQDSLLSLILLLATGIAFVGAIFCRKALQWMSTPQIVLADATSYLRIYYFGLIGVAGYNTLAGMIRSTGNSLMPTLLLAGCCLLNAALDLLLVAVFKLGVQGAAIATVIAQSVSFIVCLWYVNAHAGYIPFRLMHLALDRTCLREGLKLGLPQTLQRAVGGLGMILLQGMVNSMGVPVMTAYTLGCRIDSLAAMPIIGISQAICIFTSQNIGAGQLERIRKAQKLGLCWCYFFSALLLILFWTFGGRICALFVRDAQVIRYGWDYIRVLSLSYFFASYFEVLHGVIRGAGNTRLPMLSGSIGLFAVRLPLAFLLAGGLGYIGIWLSIPADWAVCFFITWGYVSSGHLKRRLLKFSGRQAYELQ